MWFSFLFLAPFVQILQEHLSTNNINICWILLRLGTADDYVTMHYKISILFCWWTNGRECIYLAPNCWANRYTDRRGKEWESIALLGDNFMQELMESKWKSGPFVTASTRWPIATVLHGISSTKCFSYGKFNYHALVWSPVKASQIGMWRCKYFVTPSKTINLYALPRQHCTMQIMLWMYY